MIKLGMTSKNLKKNLNIVGIMSGTSMDGVDFVLVKGDKSKIQYKDLASATYPKKLKEKILSLAEGTMGFREAQLLDFELGKFYFKKLEKIQKDKGWKIDLIGLHGQTVYHDAPSATSQIGEPSFLKGLGSPVVSDFRSKILSIGGQGAPLAPIFHNEIMKNHKNWAFLNLGGMSNVTVKESAGVSATDLGPGNVYLDYASEKLFKKPYDKGGSFALKGIPDLSIAKKYTRSKAFFKKKAPKSCGRKDFSKKDFDNLLSLMKAFDKHDIMATLCEISVLPIIEHLRGKKIKTLVVSGGGALNQYLMTRLEESLPQVEVVTSLDIGWPIQAVEGAAFASLASYKYFNKAADLSYMGIKKKLSPLGRID